MPSSRLTPGGVSRAEVRWVQHLTTDLSWPFRCPYPQALRSQLFHVDKTTIALPALQELVNDFTTGLGSSASVSTDHRMFIYSTGVRWGQKGPSEASTSVVLPKLSGLRLSMGARTHEGTECLE